MPELPEVETIVRKLKPVIVGKTVAAVEVLNPKTFGGDPEAVRGLKVIDVRRRAKIIEIVLADAKYLLTHLKMTGQYLFQAGEKLVVGGHPTADWQQQLPGKHTRVVITFQDGSKLFYNDQRKFGWIKVVAEPDLGQAYHKLGPDIVDPDLTAEYLFSKFARRAMTIKQAIMLNEIVCGVGNIYACDSLNQARISPLRPAKSLNLDEVRRLLVSMKKIIAQAIESGGTTFDGKYVDIDGKSGTYQSRVLVYGREGKNCYNCGNKILKTRIGGRGTFFCPHCQK